MEFEIKKEVCGYFKQTAIITFPIEETAESIVPDMNPDILRVLNTYATVCIQNKQCHMGTLSLSGKVKASVLYTAEDGRSMCKLDLSLPIERSFDCDRIAEDSIAATSIRISGVETRALNPRKVLIRVQLSLDILVYEKTGVELLSCEGSGGDLQLNTYKKELNLIKDVKVKSFTIAEELDVANKTADQLLNQEIFFETQDYKMVGNKAVIKGKAEVLSNCLCSETSQTVCLKHEIPFSQIIELENADEECICDIEITPVSCIGELEEGFGDTGKSIGIEITGEIKTTARKSQQLEFIADAFSLSSELNMSSVMYEMPEDEIRTAVSMKGEVSSDTGVAAASVIESKMTMGQVTIKEKDGIAAAVGDAWVNVIYEDDEGLRYCTNKKVQHSADAGNISLHARALIGTGEVNAAITDSGIKISVSLPVEFEYCKTERLEAIGSIEKGADISERRKGMPSIALVHAERGTDLWDIAKRFNVKTAGITEINGINGEKTDDERFIIVPVQRMQR